MKDSLVISNRLVQYKCSIKDSASLVVISFYSVHEIKKIKFQQTVSFERIVEIINTNFLIQVHFALDICSLN